MPYIVFIGLLIWCFVVLVQNLKSVAVNIVSDFWFVVFGIIIAGLYYHLSQRTRLWKFFGISSSQRFVIYLSRIRVRLRGAIGIDNKNRRYQGNTITLGEIKSANEFRRIFNYPLPAFSDNPDPLSKFLISDIEVQILPSPLKQKDIEKTSPFIALGSPAYNIASTYIEKCLHSQVKFRLGRETLPSESPNTPIIRPQSDTSGEVFAREDWLSLTNSISEGTASIADISPEPNRTIIQPDIATAIIVSGLPDPITDLNYGFIERIVDHEQNRCYFYVAGITEFGTSGAAYYLAKHWKELSEKYDDPYQSFFRVLRLTPDDHTNAQVIFENSGYGIHREEQIETPQQGED